MRLHKLIQVSLLITTKQPHLSKDGKSNLEVGHRGRMGFHMVDLQERTAPGLYLIHEMPTPCLAHGATHHGKSPPTTTIRISIRFASTMPQTYFVPLKYFPTI